MQAGLFGRSTLVVLVLCGFAGCSAQRPFFRASQTANESARFVSTDHHGAVPVGYQDPAATYREPPANAYRQAEPVSWGASRASAVGRNSSKGSSCFT